MFFDHFLSSFLFKILSNITYIISKNILRDCMFIRVTKFYKRLQHFIISKVNVIIQEDFVLSLFLNPQQRLIMQLTNDHLISKNE